VRLRIHRGAEEIGGNCIELQADGKSILLDLGAPLMGDIYGKLALPNIAGLVDGSNVDLLGIIISHPHADHYGLVEHAHPSTPVYMGQEAEKLLRAAVAFGPFGAIFSNVHHYRALHPFSIGPFTLTPYLVDHSAFDAYAFLIEANGKRVFYSGDLRAHGWKSWTFDKLLKCLPKGVDAMLLEGTTLGRSKTEQTQSEHDLVDVLASHMQETKGIVLAAFSGQNIDRLVTFYKAALKSRRTFVVDLYIAHLLRSVGRKSLPDPTSGSLRVYLPHRTKLKIVRDGAFDLVAPYRDRRIYASELKRRAGNIVMSFRSSMAEDLHRAECLTNGEVIYSMWPGYLERSKPNLRDWCNDNALEFNIVHTSGHASPADLKRLVSVLEPKNLIPIHTTAPEQFQGMGVSVKMVPNNQWNKL